MTKEQRDEAERKGKEFDGLVKMLDQLTDLDEWLKTKAHRGEDPKEVYSVGDLSIVVGLRYDVSGCQAGRKAFELFGNGIPQDVATYVAKLMAGHLRGALLRAKEVVEERRDAL